MTLDYCKKHFSGISILLFVQLFICCINVLICAEEFEDVPKEEVHSSSPFKSHLLIGQKINHNHHNRRNLSLVPDYDALKLQIRPGLVQFSHTKPHSLPKLVNGRRSKRASPFSRYAAIVQDVCPSVSDWVARTEATDPYGNIVTVVQRITLKGITVNQYFYETYCAANLDYVYDEHTRQYQQKYQNAEDSDSDSECRGIDKSTWNSRCRENFIWTYGKIVTNSGETGWSVIAIRGSCGCAIWPKNNEVSNHVGRGRRLSTQTDKHVYIDPFF